MRTALWKRLQRERMLREPGYFDPLLWPTCDEAAALVADGRDATLAQVACGSRYYGLGDELRRESARDALPKAPRARPAAPVAPVPIHERPPIYVGQAALLERVYRVVVGSFTFIVSRETLLHWVEEDPTIANRARSHGRSTTNGAPVALSATGE